MVFLDGPAFLHLRTKGLSERGFEPPKGLRLAVCAEAPVLILRECRSASG
jgi:hypothetical protein